jgi:hypothetical protein
LVATYLAVKPINKTPSASPADTLRYWFLRELVLKDELRSGRFGVIADVSGSVWVDSVRFSRLPDGGS